MFESPDVLTEHQWFHLLGGLTELRKTIILTVTVYYSKREKDIQSSFQETPGTSFLFFPTACHVYNTYFSQAWYVTICADHCQPGEFTWAMMWAITKVCWMLVSSPFKGPTDSVWPKDPTVNHHVSINCLLWTKASHMNRDTLIREDVPKASKLPPIYTPHPGTGEGLKHCLECGECEQSRLAGLILYCIRS